MNQAQITSAVKALLNFLAGILATHGATKAGSLVNGEDTTGIVVLLVVWVYSHFFQHTDVNEATPTPLPASKGGGTLPPLAALMFCIGIAGMLAVGCAGQNKRLEVGGAYAPVVQTLQTNGTDVITNMVQISAADFKLYAADSAFDLAYASLEAAFKIERDNRAFLWKMSPKIKHTLDEIRPKASEAVRAYTAARVKYLANPVPANETDLQTAVDTLQVLVQAAVSATAEIEITN